MGIGGRANMAIYKLSHGVVADLFTDDGRPNLEVCIYLLAYSHLLSTSCSVDSSHMAYFYYINLMCN